MQNSHFTTLPSALPEPVTDMRLSNLLIYLDQVEKIFRSPQIFFPAEDLTDLFLLRCFLTLLSNYRGAWSTLDPR